MKIPHPFELETTRLVLRSPSEQDAASLTCAINESIEELKIWMPWATSKTTEKEAIENCKKAKAAFKEGSDYRFHILLKDSLKYIGGTGLHEGNYSVPSVEIGYWIHSHYTGLGYAKEAVAALTTYALRELNVKRVEIRMSTKNEKSRSIPERLGYKLEGILRNDSLHLDGSLRDTCVFSLTDEDSDWSFDDCLLNRKSNKAVERYAEPNRPQNPSL